MMTSAVPLQFPAKAASPGRTLKVLAIGNSFSEDAMRHLYQIAADCGATEIVLGNLYIGGCELATHWANARDNKAAYDYQKNTGGSWSGRSNTTMEYGLTDEAWDVITLQQVSGKSGLADTYNSDIDNLVSYINSKKTNPQAKLGWHMTWAYQSNSNHSDFSRYGNNQMTMYNGIISAVQDKILPNKNFDLIIPSGTAVQNMRTSYVGDTLTRDGYHLSYNLGRYIAGLTWLKAITGWPIDAVTYVPSISEVPSELLPVIKEAVNNAVETPFAVTKSSYQEKQEIDLSRYKLLDWQPVGLGYWNSGSGGYDPNPQLNMTAANSKNFVSSGKRFTKDELPPGTVLVVDPGYQYRPDGWAPSGAAAPGRPDNVSTPQVVIDEAWWAGYEYRAFNVAVLGANTDITNRVNETASHFRIYVPQSGQKEITGFQINGVQGIISGNAITVELPEGTDLTALTPQITVSDKAAVSPSGGSALDFTSPVKYTVTAEDGTTQIYTVTVKLKQVYDYSGYHLLDWQPVGLAYWNSGDGAYSPDPQLTTTADNSNYYVSSGKRFTKDEIPPGTVLVIDSGYQYRPDGWAPSGSAAPGRPGPVTEERVVVDEHWWAGYEYRGFNVSFAGAGTDLTGKVDETASHFRIYVPKSDQKEITGFSINGVEGTISGSQIHVILPRGTDVTALKPVIRISDKAAVSPSGGVQTDFSRPVEYTVTAEDGTTRVYIVTVSLDYSGLTPAEVAASITRLEPPAKGAVTLTLPVAEGFDITIKSTGNSAVIAKDGTITPPAGDTQVKLVLTVSKDGISADTAELTVMVPGVAAAGDINADGKVDAADIVRLRELIRNGNATELEQAAGDLDGSGTLETADVALLMAMADIIPGDVSGEGTLSALDIMLIRKAMLEDGAVTIEQLAAGDLDGSGVFSPLDIMLIRKRMMGLS